MDTLKKEIQELSKEVLKIKKTEKEENINIRILSTELATLANKLTKAQKEQEDIEKIVEHFTYWSEEIKKAKKKAVIKNTILGGIGGAISFFLAFSPYIAMISLPIAVLLLSFGLDLAKIDKLKEYRRESAEKLGTLEKENMNIKTIQSLVNKKQQELSENTKRMNQEYNNKASELEQLKEERQNKDTTYCNLKDQIKILTEERIHLSNMLLEEHDSKVIDSHKGAKRKSFLSGNSLT